MLVKNRQLSGAHLTDLLKQFNSILNEILTIKLQAYSLTPPAFKYATLSKSEA